MKRTTLAATVIISAFGWLHAATATAGEVVMATTGFISGTQSFVDTFDMPTAGTLTVSLTDIDWPDAINGLNAFVNSGNQVVLPDFGPGTESVSVGPGSVSVHWYGTGTGALETGLFGMEVQFQPGAMAVPLPGTLALLASGLLLVAFLGRRRGGALAPAG